MIKRAVEFSVALTIVITISPILITVAIALFWLNKGRVIFCHRRVGRDGQPFLCLKFQTMRPDSDAVLSALLASDQRAAAEWAATRKLHDDPRVTPLGRILRRTSIDELPQLLNVLLGHMSFVGPRPITFGELERYGAEACRFLDVRPGLTGLWQISGRSRLTYSERVALDVAYLQRRSIGFDLLILMKTIPALMRSGDAV